MYSPPLFLTQKEKEMKIGLIGGGKFSEFRDYLLDLKGKMPGYGLLILSSSSGFSPEEIENKRKEFIEASGLKEKKILTITHSRSHSNVDTVEVGSGYSVSVGMSDKKVHNAFFREVSTDILEYMVTDFGESPEAVLNETFLRTIYTYFEKSYSFDFDKELITSLIENYRKTAENYLKRVGENRKVIKEEIKTLKENLSRNLLTIRPMDYMLDNSDKLLTEIDENLKEANRIEGINYCYLQDDDFVIHTNHVYIETDHTKFDIGELVLRTSLKTGEVTLTNKTRSVRGYSGNDVGHPHVLENDKVCLGDINLEVIQLAQTLDIVPLTRILLNFCKSVNLGDVAGRTVTRWPVVGEIGEDVEMVMENDEDDFDPED